MGFFDQLKEAAQEAANEAAYRAQDEAGSVDDAV
jgi:GTPase